MQGELLQICGLGILCAVSGLILRGKSGEMATLVRVGGLVLTFGFLLLATRDAWGEMGDLLSSSALSTYASLMLKAIGIALLCSICGDICRECGASSLANGVEMAGNLLILSLSFPILREILSYASSLLEVG